MNERRVAIVCNQHCPPARTGTQRYVLNLASYLSSIGWHVSLLPVQDRLMTRESYHIARSSGIELIPLRSEFTHSDPENVINARMQAALGQRLAERKAPSVKKLKTSKSVGLNMPDPESCFRNAVSGPLAQELGHRLRQLRPDVLFVTYFFYSPIFRLLPSDKETRRVVLCIDMFHQRAQSFKQQGLQPLIDISPEEESFFLNQSDLAVAITEADRKQISRIAPELPAITTGISFEANETDSVEFNSKIAIIGSDADHAIDGARNFVEKPWKQILKKKPDAELHVIGKVAQHIPKSRNVFKHGYVADLKTALNNINIVIHPARAGSGLKISAMEALSLGKALITSPMVTSGTIPPKTVRIARNNDDFSKITLELFKKPGEVNRLRKEAIRYTKKHLSPEIVYQNLKKNLNPE